MRLSDLVPIRAIFGKMTKLLAFELLELSKVPRLPLGIVGVHFAAGRTIVVIMGKDDVAGGCA